ncbi:hypothetical protein BU17DRAFT_68157 [Hysterangium stoloniferum]|nr:hypothetical protein BU17DRAFT_68157 [Hysterangium stoloniferum]
MQRIADDQQGPPGKSSLQSTPSVGDAQQHMELTSPFTPCLTPSSSISSSAASSPLLQNSILDHEEQSLKSFKRPRRMSIDSETSRGSSRWSTSPRVCQTTVLPSYAAESYINTTTALIRNEASHKDAASISSRFITKGPEATGDASPKKIARHSIDSTTPSRSSQSTTASLPVLSIPPAQASDLPPSSAKKRPAVRSDSPKKTPKRPARRRKGENRTTSPQPIKFRFVTVQHSTDAAETTSPPVDDEEKHVHFEEHMEEEVEEGPFEHGPTELPPRPYPGGEYADSPLKPRKKIGKVPASNLDFLPVLEERFCRLENAIEGYVEYRGQQALKNSILPTSYLFKKPNAPTDL